MTTTTGLTNDQIRAVAPSVFATRPWEEVTSRYAFIPTSDVVEGLRREGFVPVSAGQSKTRLDARRGFTRHQIRFQADTMDHTSLRALGDLRLEVVLTNSHDGASCYTLEAGLLRLVCLNGLTVGAGTVSQVRVRHQGRVDKVIDATFEVVEGFPKVLERVQSWSGLCLHRSEQVSFAKAALELRWDTGQAPIAAEQSLVSRRWEDELPSLWNTFNTVQENLVKGGQRGRSAKTGRRLKTRSVTGLEDGSRLNRGLWTLAEEMARLVKGGSHI